MEILPSIVEEDFVDVDFDDKNPRALINLMPSFIKDEVVRLQPRYFEMEAEVLEKLATPQQACFLLRQNFWDEYDRCQRANALRMETNRIIQGVGTIPWFRKWIQNKAKLAWLVRVPVSYDLQMGDIHRMGMRQFAEIMAMANTDDKGRPHTKIMEVKFKIMQHVDTRIKGAVIQRIDQRNLNMNVNANANAEQPPEAIAPNMAEIERQLEILRRKSQALTAPGQVVVDLLSEITAKADTIVGDEAKATARIGGIPG